MLVPGGRRARAELGAENQEPTEGLTGALWREGGEQTTGRGARTESRWEVTVAQTRVVATRSKEKD